MRMLKGADKPVVWQALCKLCQLANSHPDLFKDVHVQVLDNSSSYISAANWLNGQIEKQGLQLAHFNNQNFSSHFSNHISLPERVIISSNTPEPPTLKETNPEMGEFIDDMVRRKVGNEVVDYLNIDQLRVRLNEKLDMLDGYILKTEEQPSGKPEWAAFKNYTALASEIRSCITSLNKIRQGKHLMNMVIKSLIEKYTFDIARQLTSEYDHVQDELVKAGVSDAQAIKITQALKLQCAQIVAQTARNAVSDVLLQYKL